MSKQTQRSRLACWFLPVLDILASLLYVPPTIYEILTKKGNGSFSTRLFSKFWAGIAESADAQHVSERSQIIGGSRGIVVEIGPGLGPHIQCLDKTKVKRVYAVEPSKELCKGLRERADELGWGEDRYVIVNCGAEDEDELRKAGVPVGGVDTIISLQVLCTIPNPKVVLRSLYHCLKPGGELRLLEHVQSDDKATRWVQVFYDCFWHIPFGGCKLSRPTQKWLLDPEFMGFEKDGGWGIVELEKIKGEPTWSIMPKIWGRLVKKA